MKLLSLLIVLVDSLFDRLLSGKRAVMANSAAVCPHENGHIRQTAEAVFSQNFLLATRGASADMIKPCEATTEPLGAVADRPQIGDGATVGYLGSIKGTRSMVASGVINQDARVYTDAGGKVTATAVPGSYLVGRAVNSVTADGQVIEIDPVFPVAQ